MADINGYELSRAFFNWAYENPDKVKPVHTAIYFYAIEECNRMGWKAKFGFPSRSAMECLGIKNWKTYSKALNELVDFGFLEMIETSKNQYTSNIIALVNNTKALSQQCRSTYQSTYQSTVSINKLNKPINQLNDDDVKATTIDTFDISVFTDIKNLKDYYLKNLRVRNAVCNNPKNRLNNEQIPKRLDDFNKHLESKGRFRETFEEYASYFINWHLKNDSTITRLSSTGNRLTFQNPVL